MKQITIRVNLIDWNLIPRKKVGKNTSKENDRIISWFIHYEWLCITITICREDIYSSIYSDNDSQGIRL